MPVDLHVTHLRARCHRPGVANGSACPNRAAFVPGAETPRRRKRLSSRPTPTRRCTPRSRRRRQRSHHGEHAEPGAPSASRAEPLSVNTWAAACSATRYRARSISELQNRIDRAQVRTEPAGGRTSSSSKPAAVRQPRTGFPATRESLFAYEHRRHRKPRGRVGRAHGPSPTRFAVGPAAAARGRSCSAVSPVLRSRKPVRTEPSRRRAHANLGGGDGGAVHNVVTLTPEGRRSTRSCERGHPGRVEEAVRGGPLLASSSPVGRAEARSEPPWPLPSRRTARGTWWRFS